jgi:predicted nucleic acid-binding Zn ribbon protein
MELSEKNKLKYDSKQEQTRRKKEVIFSLLFQFLLVLVLLFYNRY